MVAATSFAGVLWWDSPFAFPRLGLGVGVVRLCCGVGCVARGAYVWVGCEVNGGSVVE